MGQKRSRFLLALMFLLTLVKVPVVWATSANSNSVLCDEKKMAELDECWNKLPQQNDQRIPSDPRKIESACRIFDAGMICMKNWTNTCLHPKDKEKIESSVVGAVGIYKSLCFDVKFREEFLQHADCYNRISPLWDICTKKFSNTLVKINHASDVRSLCCVRIRYTQCVSKVTDGLCTANASKFIKGLANSLMESSLKNYHSSRCASITEAQCGSVSSVQPSMNLFSSFLVFFFLRETLGSQTK